MFYDNTNIYLVKFTILLLFIAPGIWFLHKNGKEFLRNILIWAALIYLVYAIYDWLYPLADVDLSGPQRKV